MCLFFTFVSAIFVNIPGFFVHVYNKCFVFQSCVLCLPLQLVVYLEEQKSGFSKRLNFVNYIDLLIKYTLLYCLFLSINRLTNMKHCFEISGNFLPTFVCFLAI